MTALFKTVPLPTGFFLTDETRTRDLEGIIRALPEDVGVIFRHYRHPERAALAEKFSLLCRDLGRPFLVGANPALAETVSAAGVHFPSWEKIPKVKPKGVMFTASAHNEAEIERLRGLPIDAVFLGPVFKTESHPDKRPLGISEFARLARLTPLPVYALGGVTRENFKRITGLSNLAGLAGISLYI